MEPRTANNICCRIFKEQINLINQLPEKERGEVLLSAINNAFFQLENQDDNQDGNQDDGHLLRYSVSVYNSLSEISKAVLDMLQKSIRCTEFNANWGGKRSGAGRKEKKKDNQFDIFVDIVISSFEPEIKTQEQKAIWLTQNSDYLHDIFDYCNKDYDLAVIAINKCFAPLKKQNLPYSYKAVVRNLSLYYSQAVKIREAGRGTKFTPAQRELLAKVKEENQNA